MEIKVLGTGCTKCKKLEEYVNKAVEELSVEADVEKVEEIDKIMQYGVMGTPALIIDGKVIFSGKVGSIPTVKEAIQKASK
ncbi:MAG: thioredoxin family protein [Candidatus Zixiibacteriota bacterium]